MIYCVNVSVNVTLVCLTRNFPSRKDVEMKASQTKTLYIIVIILGLALVVGISIYAYREGKEDAARGKTNRATQSDR